MSVAEAVPRDRTADVRTSQRDVFAAGRLGARVLGRGLVLATQLGRRLCVKGQRKETSRQGSPFLPGRSRALLALPSSALLAILQEVYSTVLVTSLVCCLPSLQTSPQ